MGFIDKAKDFVSKNPDKVRQGIDKAGDAFDQRTGGKYADKVDRVQDEANKRLGGERQGERPGERPADPAPGEER